MHKAVIIGVGPDRGLGAQLCKRFAKEGLQVVAAGRTPASVDAVVADIQGSGGEASSFVADATKEADVAALFSHAGPDVDLAKSCGGSGISGTCCRVSLLGRLAGGERRGRPRLQLKFRVNQPRNPLAFWRREHD